MIEKALGPERVRATTATLRRASRVAVPTAVVLLCLAVACVGLFGTWLANPIAALAYLLLVVGVGGRIWTAKFDDRSSADRTGMEFRTAAASAVGRGLALVPPWVEDAVPTPVKNATLRTLDYINDDLTRKRLSVNGHEWEMLLPTHRVPWWKDYPDNGCHEPIVSGTLRAEVHPQAVFWDVGSVYGYFPSLLVHTTRIRDENVHVFEPVENHVEWIRTNLNLAEANATVNGYGLGAPEEGMVSGDKYLRAHDPPDVVKVDVDGHEGSVLRGMDGVLEAHRPVLLVEMHPFVDDYGELRESVVGILDDHYDEIYVCQDHRNRTASWSRLATAEDLPRSRDDVDAPEGEARDYMVYCRP